ncbi:MAG: SRPBCC domain-containing protein [Bacteroidetes bacterium]|nr:SRPBCC domain-containing protein [Bacteroidota bacterium]
MDDQNDYRASFSVNLPVHASFEAVHNRIPEWWTANFGGSSRNAGDSFVTVFGETFGAFEIIEIIPGKKIVWQCTDCNLHFLKNKKEWKGTQIVWGFEGDDKRSQVTMTHAGLNPSLECFEDCTGGWNHYVKNSLYKLLAQGHGEADHEDYSAKYKQ